MNNPRKRLDQLRVREINNWLSGDYAQSSSTIRGVISAWKGYGDKRYFTVRTDENKIVKCYYEAEAEPILSQHFKKQLIIIKGLLGHNVKGLNIEKIDKLESWEKSEFNSIGKFKFRKPLQFTMGFEDDMWLLQSKELDTIGEGKSYSNALDNFEENLSDAIDLYVKKGNLNKMNNKAKELQSNLQTLVISR